MSAYGESLARAGVEPRCLHHFEADNAEVGQFLRESGDPECAACALPAPTDPTDDPSIRDTAHTAA